MLDMARCAHRHGVQVVWTIMHYGTPSGLGLLDDGLVGRFAAFAAAAARALRPWCEDPPVFNPINEIGFLAWAASETNLIAPYRGADDKEGGESLRSGYAIKRRLVRAAIAAMHAILESEPRARFLHIEPLVHVVAPTADPQLEALARQVADYQWQVWDLIAGRLEPGLGGSEALLVGIGVNHYHSGQWEVCTEKRLDWTGNDPRRRPFSDMLADVYRRYGKPLVIAETSHVGEGRAAWLAHMAEQATLAMAQGVPVQGLCLYPMVDRPDWNDLGRWHRSGLFDVIPPARDPDGRIAEHPPPWRRQPAPAYIAALAHWQRRLPPITSPDPAERIPMQPTIVVFSHLRWGFVYQRPQQFMSRLARHYRIVFVEEPVAGSTETCLVRTTPAPGVDVLCPHTGIDAPGFHDAHLPVLGPMLADFLKEESISEPVAWMYTPMALPLLDTVRPAAIVYDCMDELAAFHNAPRQLRQRESALMKMADLVLTGGPSLHEARNGQHANLHCIPSAVDEAHFSPERLLPDSVEAHAARDLHAHVGRPRLGFFGVIDERMDMALLSVLADARPQWEFMMAGPVVKIDPSALPQRENLHWLGMQPYAVLPYLAELWDVCLLPFALNASTRFISPTKTLEYMAAGKPIVSTAVRDVEFLYGDCVCIAHDAAAFLAGCQSALDETPLARGERRARAAATVWRMSWDASVDTILQLLRDVMPPEQTAQPAPPILRAAG